MKLILLIALLAPFYLRGQSNLYTPDSITLTIHRNNIGRVTFMNRNIPVDEYKASDFLKSFRLVPNTDLNIRVFMENSVVNYLHQLAPDLTEQLLLESGNLQFKFFVDNEVVYTENIHHGCNFGSGGNKKTSTTFRVPLISSHGEDWWAMYMWDRFMANGGEKKLTKGIHRLKIELRPYIRFEEFSEPLIGEMIAQGEINLNIEPIVLSRKQIAVQPIAAGSGWPLSGAQINRKKIEELNKEIGMGHLKEITSVVVIHDSKLILEEYFNGASRNTLHDTRSAGKSFTSTLMGLAIRDGFIKNEDAQLKDCYDLSRFKNRNSRKDSVRLRDLLTMSSAFQGSDKESESPGNEENMYPTADWVKFTLDLPMDSSKTNGSQWDYFTAGVVLLGDILDKHVPAGLEKYADENLFKPLGITNYKWQYTPKGVVNTAGSLAMTSLEYAKYAQLYKNNGMWKGKQIVPASWIAKTFTRQLDLPERDNEGYSYLFWNKSLNYKGTAHEIYYCAGNGGNQFIIFRDLPLVIIVTSKAFNKPYAHSQTQRIVSDYLLPAIIK